MASILTRKEIECMVFALVQQLNALHDALAASGTLADGYGSNHFHRDISAQGPFGDFMSPTSSSLQVSAASAVDLATTIVMANNLLGVLASHVSDDSAHLVQDTVAMAALAALSPLASTAVVADVEVLLTSLQNIYNAHRVASGVHVSNDTVNTWTGSAPVDLPTSEAAANFGKAILNDHILSGPVVGRVRVVPA